MFRYSPDSEPGSGSVVRRAPPVFVQLPADRVDGVLSHQPVGGQLAAGDRHKAVDAVALAVVEQRVRARDVSRRSAVATLAVLEQRPHSRPHTQRAGLLEPRNELLAVVEHRVDLVLKHAVVVGVVGVHVGRADHAHRPDRNDDVAVGGHLAAVDHRVHQPVVHRDHDPPARHDVDPLDSRHLRDASGPCAGSADRDPRVDVDLLAGEVVAQTRTADVIAVAMDRDRLVVGEHPRAALARSRGQRPDQKPRVDAAVRHAERPRDAGIQPRLLTAGLRRIDLLAGDARIAAPLGEAVGVVGVVERRRDEEPAGVLDAGRGDPSDDPVLVSALLGGVGILDRVTAAGMHEPVKSSARARGEIAAIGKHHIEAA